MDRPKDLRFSPQAGPPGPVAKCTTACVRPDDSSACPCRMQPTQKRPANVRRAENDLVEEPARADAPGGARRKRTVLPPIRRSICDIHTAPCWFVAPSKIRRAVSHTSPVYIRKMHKFGRLIFVFLRCSSHFCEKHFVDRRMVLPDTLFIKAHVQAQYPGDRSELPDCVVVGRDWGRGLAHHGHQGRQ